MRPPEVLDHQAALIDYLDSRYYRAYLDRLLGDMQRKGKIGSVTGTEMAQVLQTSLKMAQAVHIDRDMMPLLRAASVDLDADDHLIHSRLPAEHGFVLFDQPWVTSDVWGDEVHIAGFLWRHGSARTGTTAVPGIYVTHLADMADPDDPVSVAQRADNAQMARHLGRFQVSDMWFLGYGKPVGQAEGPSPEQYAQFATDGLTPAASITNPVRLVVALFRLLTQVIVEVADAPVDRNTARRMTRKNLPARVQTVKLRRRETIRDEEAHGDGHVEWQHSWVVRGHWAWRACREDHPTAEPYEKGHRTRVYVAPYFKGPDDKPLLISEKVWGLSR